VAAPDDCLAVDIIDECEVLRLRVRLILRVKGRRVGVAGGIFTDLEEVVLEMMLLIFY
jgi:hypothetical protein